MKTRTLGILLLAISGLLWPISTVAESTPPEKAGAKQGNVTPRYNPDTVETFTAEVISVEGHRRARPYGWGVHLRVRKNGEILPVHLGPIWFLNDYDFYVKEGETLTITGSRIMDEGETAVVASEIKVGDDLLTLRDEQGRPVWTAAGRGMDNWGRGGEYGRLYDPKTSETVAGEILEMGYFSPKRGARRGVHLKLRSGADIVFVHLGPRWFIENQDILLFEGDEVEVTGSRILIDGKPTIIAASIRDGDNVLMLRDKDGIPVWAGWRKRK
jgi:hypothetical protein